MFLIFNLHNTTKHNAKRFSTKYSIFHLKGKTLHWVNCQDAVKAEVRLYDRLFSIENPGADERDFRDLLNPDSLKVLNNCYVEPYLKEKKPGDFLQFQRIGYFTPDLDSTPDHLVFNKTVGLKDTWKR